MHISLVKPSSVAPKCYFLLMFINFYSFNILVTCSADQDIYIILDYAIGFSTSNIFPTGYLIREITDAIKTGNPVSTVTGVVYPTKFTYKNGAIFLKRDVNCKQAILDIEKIIGLYDREGSDNPRSDLALRIVSKAIADSNPGDKAIAVITITADPSHEYATTIQETQRLVNEITGRHDSVRFISAGLKTPQITGENNLLNELLILANNKERNRIYVETEGDIETLIRELLGVLKREGVLCPEKGEIRMNKIMIYSITSILFSFYS